MTADERAAQLKLELAVATAINEYEKTVSRVVLGLNIMGKRLVDTQVPPTIGAITMFVERAA